MSRLAGLCADHPWLTIGAHLALLVSAALVLAQRFSSLAEGSDDPAEAIALALYDNSLERVWGTSPEPVAHYERFRERFGSDHLVAWVVAGQGPLEPADLQLLQRAAEGFTAPGPHRAEVLWAGSLPYAPPLGEAPLSAEAVEAFAARVASDPAAGRLLATEDAGWSAALLVAVDPATLNDANLEALVPLLRARFAALDPPPDVEAHGMGVPVLLGEVRAAIVRGMRTNLPLVNLVVLGLCLLVFRRPRVVGMVLGTVLQGEALSLALFLGTGRAFNYVSCFMAISIVVLGFAACIHLFVRLREERRVRPVREALDVAVDTVARPCGVSLATTCAALLALTTAEQVAIVDFGLFSAAGMVLVLLCTFSLAPALVSLVDPGETAPGHPLPGLPTPAQVGVFAWRHAGSVLAVAAAVMALCAVGATRLELGSNIRESFVARGEVSRAIEFVSERVPGIAAFEVALSWDADAQPADAVDAVERSRAVEDAVRSGLRYRGEPLRQGAVFSAADAARSLCVDPDHAPVCADGWPLAPALKPLAEEIAARGPPRYIAHDGDAWGARVTVLLDLPYAHEGIEVAERIEQLAEGADPGVRARVTGLGPLWNELEDSVVSDLMDSFAVGAAVVVLLLALFLRSGRALLLALPANLFPLVVVAGAAGWVFSWTGYHVNSTVMMYLTVSVGIIVDDTVFWLLAWQRERRAGAAGEQAVRRVLEEVGGGITLTSASLCLGFAVLTWSDFVNSRILGVLTSATILMALVGDLLLLPACCRVLSGLGGGAEGRG
ncbi:MAG: MMPL family transporter [Alphaproteobacteria bacterium]|nr:MMPL family transporter [Alphaproteobacteria bacterium]